MSQQSFILACTPSGQLGVDWPWLAMQVGVRSAPGVTPLRPAAVGGNLPRARAETREVSVSCTKSANTPFAKSCHVDKPKVREQRTVFLGWGGREYV